MKINKIVILSFLTAFLFPIKVDLDRASNISKNFFEGRTGETYSTSNIQIISEEENALLYVFILNPTGFIIVSGNDAAMPILGYSFENEFRQDELPIQLDWMFEQY